MSDRQKSLINQVAFWAFLLTITGLMGKGVWHLSQMHKDVQDIKFETKAIRPLENRVLKIETKLGISKTAIDTNSVFSGEITGDL